MAHAAKIDFTMNSTPLISVILPVRNEARALPDLLALLAQQEFPAEDFEIIVADGRSSDGTRQVVEAFATQSPVRVKLVDNPGIRSAPGRNAGLQAASGEFVLFIDGHCHIPSVTLLRDTLFIFQETDAACLCRPQPLLAPTGSQFGSAVAAVRASALGHGRDSRIYDMTHYGFVDPASSGAAYRREVFAEIGIYDENFDACEDVELNTRLRKSGMAAYTDPRLAVFYEPRQSLASLVKQMMRYGNGRVRLMRKHPDCLSLGQIAPALLIAWIVAAILFSLLGSPGPIWLRSVIVAPVVVYGVAVLLWPVALVRKSGLRLLYLGPVIFCTVHLGLGLGIWSEIIRTLAHALKQKSPPKAAKVTEC